MAIGGPLKWHGGKAYLASKIVGLMPPHIHYVEPYFGGGSVLLAKEPGGCSEVVNDMNGGLVNFWRVLKSPTQFPKFERALQATPFCEAEWKESAKERLDLGQRDPEGDWRDAVAFFVRCRQSLAGRMKGFTGVTRTRTRRGMNNEVSAWLTAIEGLPAVHERLKRVLILNRPADVVIKGQDGPDTCFYCDPPYVHETRATTGEYEHEMDLDDHRELLETLAGIKGKFLLSGYSCELYDDYADKHQWRRADFEIDNKAAGGKTKRKMIECVWMNY